MLSQVIFFPRQTILNKFLIYCICYELKVDLYTMFNNFTAQNTRISPNLLLRKLRGNIQFSRSFATIVLSEIMEFSAVFLLQSSYF